VLALLGIGPAADAKDLEIAVLRHQLMVLRRQVARPRYTPSDRLVLATLARLLPRERWSAFLVTPAALLRWHRDLVRRRWTYAHRPGRRRGLDPAVVDLVLRMARENPRWGYQRIAGECAKLGVTGIGDLDPDDPAPAAGGTGPAPRRTDLGVRAPKANAYAERWVRTFRTECLDWLLIRNRRHLERVLGVYVEHYNSARPHRGLDLQTPLPASPLPARPGRAGPIERIDRLGGLIHEYRHAARPHRGPIRFRQRLGEEPRAPRAA
jgi:hypothetical protein